MVQKACKRAFFNVLKLGFLCQRAKKALSQTFETKRATLHVKNAANRSISGIIGSPPDMDKSHGMDMDKRHGREIFESPCPPNSGIIFEKKK